MPAKKKTENKAHSDEFNEFLKEIADDKNLKIKRKSKFSFAEHTSLEFSNPVINAILNNGVIHNPPSILLGAIYTIEGLSNTGKTTLALQMGAEFQRNDGVLIVINTEHTKDRRYWTLLVESVDDIIYKEVDNIDDIFGLLHIFINKFTKQYPDKPVCMVVDSLSNVGASCIMDEIEKVETLEDYQKIGVGSKSYGSDAAVIKANFEKLTHRLAGTNITVLFIRHLYAKMGGRGGHVGRGGEGPFYNSAVILRLRKIQEIKDTSLDVSAKMIEVFIFKYKYGPNNFKAEVPLLGDTGFDPNYTMYHWGKATGLIKGTSWKSIGDFKFQNYKQFKEFLETKEGEEFQTELKLRLKEVIK